MRSNKHNCSSFTYPRLLIIDMTPTFGSAATSTIKDTLFDDWPRHKIAAISSMINGRIDLSQPNNPDKTILEGVSHSDIMAFLDIFKPEMILYRPLADRKVLHELAMRIISRQQVPHFIWIMDDWLERLKHTDSKEFQYYETDVRKLVASAAGNLSISNAMSNIYKKRYRAPFTAIANGVDITEWSSFKRSRPIDNKRGMMIVRYCGGLAKDMTLTSIILLAECVESLSLELNISFEINTAKHWADKFGNSLLKYKSVRLSSNNMDTETYRKWLSSGDINVLAYNFDNASINYIRYSMANKLPECMASAVPILAIGPAKINTIKMVRDLSFVKTVENESAREIRDALRWLYHNPTRCYYNGLFGVDHAKRFFSKHKNKEALREIFSRGLGTTRPPENGSSNWLEYFPSMVNAYVNHEHESTNKVAHQHLMEIEKPADSQRQLRVTVVVPNYNGEDYIEATLLSIISQNYSNIQLIVVDGDSSDSSLSIIKRYQTHIDILISEPDYGHTHALNKGFAHADGDIMTWLNSDDILAANTLSFINRMFLSFEHVHWITGRNTHIDTHGTIVKVAEPKAWSWQRFMAGDFRYIQQEGTFWRKGIWERSGSTLNEKYQLASDLDLWCRFFQHEKLYTADTITAMFRSHDSQRSKIALADYNEEAALIMNHYFETLNLEQLEKHADVLSSRFTSELWQNNYSLPPNIQQYDTPILKYCQDLSKYCMWNAHLSQWFRRNVIPPYEPTCSVLHKFDGQHRLEFNNSPNFSSVTIRDFKCVFEATSPAGMVFDGKYSEQLPATILICGPLIVMQTSKNSYTIQIKGSEKTYNHTFNHNPLDSVFFIHVNLDQNAYAISVNGHRIASSRQEHVDYANAKQYISLGAGFLDRYWPGNIFSLELDLEDSNSIASHWVLGNSDIQNAQLVQRDFLEDRADITDKPMPRPNILKRFRGRHQGERCFVMGSGPSLNNMDLSLLKDETVFACNGIFLLFNRINWRPKYYTCVDTRVLMDRHFDIKTMLYENPEIVSFFPSFVKVHGEGKIMNTREIIGSRDSTYYFNEVGHNKNGLPQSMFSTDAGSHMVMPYTVTITMLQLAVYMGFREIYLIGCDTNYSIPDSVKQSGDKIKGVGLHLEGSADDDPNHFDPTYFGKGRKYHNPQTHNMIEHYKFAKAVTDEIDVSIFNATVGGMLEVFPRVDYRELLGIPPC